MVKSFELIPRPLNKGPRPRQFKLCFSFHGIILEGNQLVWSKKKNNLKESSWFGEPKCDLGFKGAHFLFIFTDSFYPCCSNYVRMKDILWMEDIVEITPTPPFYINFRIDMTSFVDVRWLLERVHFQLSSAQNESDFF